MLKISIPPDIDRAILPALRTFPHQRYDQAPYGILWYLISKPLAFGDNALSYVFLSATVNLLVSTWLLLLTSFPFTVLFFSISLLHVVKAQWNLPILWLTLLGFIWPWLLIVPILAKFPVGNFQAHWWQIQQALTWQKNPYYYLSLVLVWAVVFFQSTHL